MRVRLRGSARLGVRLFWLQCILTLLGLLAVYGMPTLAVDVRFLLFGKHTAELAPFAMDRGTFERQFAFKLTAPAKLAPGYRASFLAEARLPVLPSISLDSPSQVKQIVMAFSRNGGARCGVYRSLGENFRLLRQGVGCCADHSAALMAAAAEHGIFVREVHHRLHTFDEFYDPARGKWIWVDPMFAVMARDGQGAYFSLVELAAAIKAGQAVNYDFFGSAEHEFSRQPPTTHPFYRDASNFDWLAITLGNNVLEYDAFRATVLQFPKPVQQFAAYFSGIKAGYLVYHATFAKAVLANGLKGMCWLIVIFYPLNMVLLLILAVRCFVDRAKQGMAPRLKVSS